jgi:peptidoglycan/xylan/chitin deacetylase (PgdA/CDA1 family)
MFVLNFHAIGVPGRELIAGEENVCVSSERFIEILDAVAERDNVELTFDDGNCSDIDEVLPALQERDMHAHFFVCPALFGAEGYVDESDVRELRDAGMLVGSHGMDHVDWRNLSGPGLEREVVHAKRLLEEAIDEPVVAAACPFGAYDRRSLNALREAGFERVYTSDGGPAGAGDWLVARNTVSSWDSAESIESMLDSANGGVPLGHRVRRLVKQWR